MTSGRFVMQLAEPSRATLNYVAFSPDGKLIATCDNNGSVTLWDTTTGRIIASVTDPNSDTGVSAVAFSQDGQFLAIGEQSGRIALYNLAQHTISAAVTDPCSPLRAAKRIMVASLQPSVRMGTRLRPEQATVMPTSGAWSPGRSLPASSHRATTLLSVSLSLRTVRLSRLTNTLGVLTCGSLLDFRERWSLLKCR
jgi:WD40 repeat protein